jgi:hypothetical protein
MTRTLYARRHVSHDVYVSTVVNNDTHDTQEPLVRSSPSAHPDPPHCKSEYRLAAPPACANAVGALGNLDAGSRAFVDPATSTSKPPANGESRENIADASPSSPRFHATPVPFLPELVPRVFLPASRPYCSKAGTTLVRISVRVEARLHDNKGGRTKEIRQRPSSLPLRSVLVPHTHPSSAPRPKKSVLILTLL